MAVLAGDREFHRQRGCLICFFAGLLRFLQFVFAHDASSLSKLQQITEQLSQPQRPPFRTRCLPLQRSVLQGPRRPGAPMIATLHRNSEKEATLRRRRLPHARNPPKANHTQSLYNYPGQNIHLKARPTTPTLRSARSPSNPAPQKRLVRSPGLTSSADWTIPRLGRSWQNRYARPTAWRNSYRGAAGHIVSSCSHVLFSVPGRNQPLQPRMERAHQPVQPFPHPRDRIAKFSRRGPLRGEWQLR